MTVYYTLDPDKKLTDEELEELEALKDRPVAYDEDCPPLTEDQLAQMHRIAQERRQQRRKQTVALRLSPQALRKAQSLGKGYTSVLSRILEDVLSDNEKIKKYL